MSRRRAAPVPLLRGSPARPTLALALVLSAAACLPARPYVTTQLVGDWRLDWFHDGPPVAITAHNPTGSWARVLVRCAGDDVPEPPPYPVWVPPHEDVRLGFGQVMNKYAMDACWAEEP